MNNLYLITIEDSFWIGAFKNPGFVIRAMSRDPLKHISWEPSGKRKKDGKILNKHSFGKVCVCLKLNYLKKILFNYIKKFQVFGDTCVCKKFRESCKYTPSRLYGSVPNWWKYAISLPWIFLNSKKMLLKTAQNTSIILKWIQFAVFFVSRGRPLGPGSDIECVCAVLSTGM